MWIKATELRFPDENFRNYLIKKFGVAINTNDVKMINCNDLNIKSLKGIEFFEKLEYLCCCFNDLKEIDLSKNINLKYLNCRNNELTELNLSNNFNLEVLHCAWNNLATLDLTNNIKIKGWYCGFYEVNKIHLKNKDESIVLDSGNNVSVNNLPKFDLINQQQKSI